MSNIVGNIWVGFVIEEGIGWMGLMIEESGNYRSMWYVILDIWRYRVYIL